MATAPKRPGTLTAAAVLLLIFGILSLLGSVCGGIGFIAADTIEKAVADLIPKMPGGEKQPDPLAGPKLAAKEAPAYYPVELGSLVVHFALGVLAIIAGLATLRMQPSGRRLGILAALGKMVFAILQSGYAFVFVLPLLARVADDQAKLRPPGMPDTSALTKITSYVFAAAGLLIQLAIWFVVILLLRSKSATDAFAGKFPDSAPGSDEDRRRRYEGYEDDDAGPPPLPRSPGDTGITDRER